MPLPEDSNKNHSPARIVRRDNEMPVWAQNLQMLIWSPMIFAFMMWIPYVLWGVGPFSNGQIDPDFRKYNEGQFIPKFIDSLEFMNIIDIVWLLCGLGLTRWLIGLPFRLQGESGTIKQEESGRI